MTSPVENSPSPAKLLATEKRICRWRGDVKIWVPGEIKEEPVIFSSSIDFGNTDFRAVKAGLPAVHISNTVSAVLVASTDGCCSSVSNPSMKPP